MYYQVTIGYETETMDREGNPRIKKVPILVEAESTEEATLVVANYRAESPAAVKTIEIKETKIDDVLSTKLTPDYYKGK